MVRNGFATSFWKSSALAGMVDGSATGEPKVVVRTHFTDAGGFV